LFGAAAIWVFGLGLRDFAGTRFLPARGVEPFVFFLVLAMLRP
jgi:hypothetical protein